MRCPVVMPDDCVHARRGFVAKPKHWEGAAVLHGAVMEEWVRVRAEETQKSVVCGKAAMTTSPALYFTTRRCTYSDVVSIMTTTRPTSKAGLPQKQLSR